MDKKANLPGFSGPVVESELNRIRSNPLFHYLDGLVNELEERLVSVALPPGAVRHPCRLCKGAGFLILSGQLFSTHGGKLEPVKRKSGGAINVPTTHHCPRCLGVQYDLEDMVAEYNAQLADMEQTAA